MQKLSCGLTLFRQTKIARMTKRERRKFCSPALIPHTTLPPGPLLRPLVCQTHMACVLLAVKRQTRQLYACVLAALCRRLLCSCSAHDTRQLRSAALASRH